MGKLGDGGKEVKRLFLGQNTCMQCGNVVGVRWNARCLETCPSNYCDACFQDSRSGKGECKGCEARSGGWYEEVAG